MADETFGGLLRTGRLSHGFSLRNLGMRTGLPYPYIWMLEEGKDDPPSTVVVIALAKALGMRPETLLYASIRQRARVELAVPWTEGVGTAALLAAAWPELGEAGRARLREALAGGKT